MPLALIHMRVSGVLLGHERVEILEGSETRIQLRLLVHTHLCHIPQLNPSVAMVFSYESLLPSVSACSLAMPELGASSLSLLFTARAPAPRRMHGLEWELKRDLLTGG